MLFRGGRSYDEGEWAIPRGFSLSLLLQSGIGSLLWDGARNFSLESRRVDIFFVHEVASQAISIQHVK